ncbi:hypothetical protein R1flu_012950 [Riccia fluitans]|uniref:Uncharacterized protein n=1 Tax=Riccia fluitans TaxID=41844 RepID=A0ABD1ZDA9_9MARC
MWSNDKVCKTVTEGDDFASGGKDLANGGDSFANGGDLFRSRSKEVCGLTIRYAKGLPRGRLCQWGRRLCQWGRLLCQWRRFFCQWRQFISFPLDRGTRSNDKVCKTVIEGGDFASGGEDFASGGNYFASGGDLSRSCSTEVQRLTITSTKRLQRKMTSPMGAKTLPVGAKTSPVGAIASLASPSPPLAKYTLSTYIRRQRPLLELKHC